MARQADSWRGSPTERGFSMALGRLGAPGDENCVIATATENGVLRGILHFVPWGTDGLSLDLMRRDRSAPAGRERLPHRGGHQGRARRWGSSACR